MIIYKADYGGRNVDYVWKQRSEIETDYAIKQPKPMPEKGVDSGFMRVHIIKAENHYNASRHRQKALEARPGEDGGWADNDGKKPKPKFMGRPFFAPAVGKNDASENRDSCDGSARESAYHYLLKGRDSVGRGFDGKNSSAFSRKIGEKADKGV